MSVNLAQASKWTKPSARNVRVLRQVFKAIDAESCPTTYNFHMHTVCSDGQLQPEMLMQQAVEIGLKGLAITDHHTVNGYRAAQDWLDKYQERSLKRDTVTLPHLWIGVEVTSQLLGTEVHILGYGFDPETASMRPYLQQHSPMAEDAQAEQVIACLHAAGGVAVLAHPARYRRSPEELISAAAHMGIDGVETYYAYDNPHPWRTSPSQTARVENLSQSYGLLSTCGTDTHGLNLRQRL